MPLPGGASAKAGLRYEGLWTVHCMIDVMQDKAESIWLEPPGEEGAGVEFILSTPTGVEYHQVKRQTAGRGRWTLSGLSSEGVLAYFYNKLSDPSAACVFVSTHAADTLEELASRARDAGSWEEFDRTFLSSGSWSTHFADLHTRWRSSSQEDSYQRLKRVDVRTVDETFLKDAIHNRLEVLVNANPATVAEVLSSLALNQVHLTLTSTEIWGHLQERGFSKQTWAQDPSITDKVEELNQTYLIGIQPVGIGGEVVPRDEVEKILHYYGAEDAGDIALVTGQAGVGKSSVLAQVLTRIKALGWPLLTLRVDRLEPRQSPSDVGHQLGLPASPASVLASIATGKDCLLVIDQLDAISLASGRNPEFFDCIGAIIAQAQHHPNMRVLLACRKFDVENDHRFRQLIGDNGIAQEFPLGLFDEETTRGLVTRMGIDATRLNSKQIALLSLPVHLRLLSEAIQDSQLNSIGFQSAKDLYDKFWEYKQQKLGRSHVEIGHFLSAIDFIIDHMNNHETLSAPASLLDAHPDVLRILASENIVIKDGSRVSFFHEGFFDYMFARRMESTGFDLLTYILERDQSLFLRSQVRQVLLHQRDTSPLDALSNVRALLTSDDIRPHLKTIVLAWLGSLDDPKKEEWEVIEPLLDSNLATHVRQAMHESLPWFDLLDSIGSIERWLTEASRVDWAFWLLWAVQKHRADRVAALVAPFVGLSESWDQRLKPLILSADIATSRGFFNLVVEAVKKGTLDSSLKQPNLDQESWYPIEHLIDRNPEWACELIACYCDRLFVLTQEPGEAKPFSYFADPLRTGAHVMIKAAQAAPWKFIEQLYPLLVTTLDTFADKIGNPPWRDPIWSYPVYADNYDLGANFLTAMESAMRDMAEKNPDAFRAFAEELRSSKFLTIQYILVRSYEANGRVFADDAVEYLLELPARLATGYSSGTHWATRQLLEATTPHCSPENLERLERLVLEYYPDYEKEPSNRIGRGYAQLELLEGIEVSRLSTKAFRRLQELRRKFANSLPSEPPSVTVGVVGSPVPEQAALKMDDYNWLRAMKQYSSDSHSYDPAKFLMGGALELSRVLESQTEEDPARFANLLHSIPDDANPAYFEAILRGIKGLNLDTATIVAACLRCHRLPGRPLGRWITGPLAHSPQSSLPVEALEMVAWYATEGADPDNELWGASPGQQSPNYSRDLLTAGINSVRGAAAETIAQLIFDDASHLAFFEPYLRAMVNDRSVAVRTCVAHVLLSILRHNRDFAVELFLVLCQADERLLATRYVEIFLHYAGQTHFQQLEPVLSRMVESQVEDVARAGARQGCLAALEIEDALPLANRCFAGSKSLRLGATEVYSANLFLFLSKAPSELSAKKCLAARLQTRMTRSAALQPCALASLRGGSWGIIGIL